MSRTDVRKIQVHFLNTLSHKQRVCVMHVGLVPDGEEGIPSEVSEGGQRERKRARERMWSKEISFPPL